MLSPAFSSSSRDAKKPLENPFKPPKDDDIFELRSREKEHRKMELQRQLGLKVHEKVTYAGRVKVKQANLRRILCDGQEEVEKTRAELQGKESRSHLQILPAVKMAMIKDRNIDKESISEFIMKKREMFLLEYSLAVKNGEIAQLEKVAAEEERKLMQAEMLLENDTVLFDEFLKENDKNSVEAIKIAEQETKAKLERIAEIKRITTKIVSIKSDISKSEDILKEYTLYKDFLFKLSPPEWQEAQRTKADPTKIQSTKNEDKKKANEKEKDKKTGCNIVSKGSFSSRDLSHMKDPKASRPNRKSTSPSDKASNVSDQDSEGSEYEAQPELFFTDPQQLLDLLTELEEQNLSLIQNSRETEEALEDIRYTMDLTQKKMLRETEQLTQQIDVMNQTIQRERERATELELRSHLFNYGNYNSSDDQEGLLDTLGRKVEEVYRSCVGDNEGNLSTLLMLTAIEGRLGELLENAEMIPRDRLLLAERAKDKERRLRLRDEKIREQKKHQEERLKRALERAQADIKKTTGKKLMNRSQPPVYKQKKSQENPLTDKEMEEHLYFFT